MRKIAIAIYDSDEVHRKALCRFVLRCSIWGNGKLVLSQYSDRLVLFESLKKGKDFDYVFFEIGSLELNRSEMNDIISTLSRTNVIFTSDKMENQPFVDDCYPAMLLPKPFTQELCENILIAFRARLDALSTFDYHEYGAEHSIPCNDIYFFSMESQHLMITTMSGTYQDASLKLKDVERDFNSNGFFRCHKSHIINLRYYDRQDYSSVYLNCHGKTYQIRLSKGKRQELKETVANWKSRSRL